MDQNEVLVAFEILMEEIEAVTNSLNEAGAEAFRAGDYEKARRAIEEATRLAEFRERVKALQQEWSSVFARKARRKKVRAHRSIKKKLARGLRTPEEAFRRPILEALIELGGQAPIGEVLERVGHKMNKIFNSFDREPLPSNPKCIRWRNTAQWCRNTLVREGLMKNDSPYGIWEISDAGREWLRQESSKP